MLGSGLAVLVAAAQRGVEPSAASPGGCERVPAPATTPMPTAHERVQPTVAPFSARERQVLSLVAGGATSSEIAELLKISVHTVKNHRKNLLRKAGCRNSGQLITRCSALGMF